MKIQKTCNGNFVYMTYCIYKQDIDQNKIKPKILFILLSTFPKAPELYKSIGVDMNRLTHSL